MANHRIWQNIFQMNRKKKTENCKKREEDFIRTDQKKIEELEENGSHFQTAGYSTLSDFR